MYIAWCSTQASRTIHTLPSTDSSDTSWARRLSAGILQAVGKVWSGSSSQMPTGWLALSAGRRTPQYMVDPCMSIWRWARALEPKWLRLPEGGRRREEGGGGWLSLQRRWKHEKEKKEGMWMGGMEMVGGQCLFPQTNGGTSQLFISF